MLWWVVDSLSFLVALVLVCAGVFFLKRKQFDESVTSKRVAARVEQEYAAALLRRIHDVDNPVVVEEQKPTGAAATSSLGGDDDFDDELSETSRASSESGRDEKDKKRGGGLLSKIGSSANAGVDFITRKKKSDNE